ncbi:pentatricopeptide repeat-containing protein At5g57250, mitochondrial-like [Macadamia integrifolia]|uniref:pentatricopeptide repeat-containing protein At5g57250, mitochondrial-like n=1 Tax=Macadamia integrifolia TaxID=60698 RepID=UPI001C4E7309|nr:pentatricopeptide repeat-containing protein At5g57250, mitochondrial-like [Macadamia integrifolia]
MVDQNFWLWIIVTEFPVAYTFLGLQDASNEDELFDEGSPLWRKSSSPTTFSSPTTVFVIQLGKDGFLSRSGIWESLIQSICVAGKNPEKACSLLRDCLRNRSSWPSFSTFSLLINSFSSLGKMDRAIEVLEMMTDEKIGHPVNNSICSSIISGFCRIGNPELALKFYENVEKIESFRPNVVTYTALVSALCIECRVKEVSDLVCRMEKEGIVLDAIFYSSWICGYFIDGILQEAY